MRSLRTIGTIIFFLFLFFLLSNATLLWAIGAHEVDANKLVARITYVDGNDLSIVNSDRNRNISYDNNTMGMLAIYEGASIITGDDTFVEILLNNSRSLIKVAENTHFRLQHVELEAGQSLFHVITGRIRAKIDKLSSNHQFYFVGGNSVSGIRGTDFAIAVTGTELKSSEARIYCFEGEVEVFPLEYLKPVPVEGLERTVVSADEMVTVPPEDAPTVLPKTDIPEDMRSYWEEHSFKTKLPADNMLDTSDQQTSTSRSKVPYLVTGGTLFGLGAAAETVGIVFLATLSQNQASDAFNSQKIIGTSLAAGGGALLIGSAVTLFIGLLLEE